MTCPACHGRGVAHQHLAETQDARGTPVEMTSAAQVPCPICAGLGVVACCEGECAQPVGDDDA